MSITKETAVVVSQKEIGKDIFDMVLSFPKGAKEARPGQFLAMYCNDATKLLPRPISICGIDAEAGTLRVVYRIAGEGTREFSKMKQGDTLEVMGPLGNGFAMKEGKAILVGGGIGIPPMLELAKQYPAYGFDVHKGYGTRAHYAALEACGPCPIHRMTFLKKFYGQQ